MRIALFLRSWLVALLVLGGCCIEESPAVVSFSDAIEADLEETCRLSSLNSLTETAVHALATYLKPTVALPNPKQICTERYGSACQFDHPCDEPVDMSGPDRCPPDKPAPPRRYYVCFGCGMQTELKPNHLRLHPTNVDLLDRVTRESGAPTREEALHRALLNYKAISKKKRQKPDFYQHDYNLPIGRKPDEPCRFR